jgi:uncharacterized membrane protein YkoI
MKLLLNIAVFALQAVLAGTNGYAQQETFRDPSNRGTGQDDSFRERDRGNIRLQNELFPQPAQEEQARVSRREASDLARGSYPGRVLSIRLDGRQWRVRMDEGGTVFNVFVDADNGQVVRPSE